MSSSGPRMQIDADSPNLDVLRACAVLVVLAFHTVGFFNRGLASNLGLEQLGRLAVLFFFVHTCLVLMLSLERQTADSIRQRARRQLFSDGPLADDRGARPHRHRCQW